MKIRWSESALADYKRFQKEHPKIFEKINSLIRNIEQSPFEGLGKPEPLKHALSGWWSRRITDEHRLVYRVTRNANEQLLEIAQCRYHY